MEKGWEYNIPIIQARKIHTLQSLDGRYIILFYLNSRYRESIVFLSLPIGEGTVILFLAAPMFLCCCHIMINYSHSGNVGNL